MVNTKRENNLTMLFGRRGDAEGSSDDEPKNLLMLTLNLNEKPRDERNDIGGMGSNTGEKVADLLFFLRKISTLAN